MNTFLHDLTADKGFATVDVKEICTTFTTDVITSVVFGLAESDVREEKSSHMKHLESLLFSTSFLKKVISLTFYFAPDITKYIPPKLFSNKSEKFLENAVKSVMKNREVSGTTRNDLIDTLIHLRKESIEFADNAIIMQATSFLSAGFKSSLSVMYFALYELAKNQTIQKTLRSEIKNTLSENEGLITYEVVTMGMPYLNNVVQEALRLYPAAPFIDRELTLLDGEPEYSLEPFGDYKVPDGSPIYIPILSIHRSRKFFPHPKVFDPERFAPENKSKLISGSYLPFGIGPNNCIEEKFGLIQLKVGLINFLKGHYLKFNTKSQKDMVFDNGVINLQAKGGIYLDIVKEN